MADIFSRQKRSEIMSRVKGRGNKLTELRLIKLFRARGFTGWRRNSRIFGHPDFIFPHLHIAVFVDGCFWHGCPIHGQLPESNRDFWMRKLQRDKSRDILVNSELRKRGWKTVRIWQHELRDANKVARRLARYIQAKDILGR